jgi:hypothetical protein
MSSQSVSIGKPRQIFAQGSLDGSCFLYCIINSFVALSSRPAKITDKWISEKWTEPLRSLPFKLDDFLIGPGTSKIDDDLDCLEGLCRAYFRGISGAKMQVTRKASNKSLRASLTTNQVAIVAIPKNGDHWLCIVDADKDCFYAACSAQALYPVPGDEEYCERKSPNHHRLYNRVLTAKELEIWKDYAILITNTGAKGQA